jgi:glutamine amidotransferase
VALDHGGGRLTMLATDGRSLAAVVVGEPVHILQSADGCWIASEPHDDSPGWREIPDLTAVELDGDALAERSL